MRVQIATRGSSVPEDVQARAVDQIQKLERFDSEVLSADLVFEEVRHLRKVEAIVSIANSEPMVVTGEKEEWLSAVDELVERLGRMLRRHRERRTERHPRNGAPEFGLG